MKETIIAILINWILFRAQPAATVGRGAAVTDQPSRVETSLGGWQRVKYKRPGLITGCLTVLVLGCMITAAVTFWLSLL